MAGFSSVPVLKCAVLVIQLNARSALFGSASRLFSLQRRAREVILHVRMSVRQFDLRVERSWLWKQSKHFMCYCESLEVITILPLSVKTCIIYTHTDINKQPAHMLSQLKITNTFTPCIWTLLSGLNPPDFLFFF